jgi:hypothetical protein
MKLVVMALILKAPVVLFNFSKNNFKLEGNTELTVFEVTDNACQNLTQNINKHPKHKHITFVF